MDVVRAGSKAEHSTSGNRDLGQGKRALLGVALHGNEAVVAGRPRVVSRVVILVIGHKLTTAYPGEANTATDTTSQVGVPQVDNYLNPWYSPAGELGEQKRQLWVGGAVGPGRPRPAPAQNEGREAPNPLERLKEEVLGKGKGEGIQHHVWLLSTLTESSRRDCHSWTRPDTTKWH